MLPTHESKLLAKLHGAYEVICKVAPLTYEIHMPERKVQKFHINQLKELSSIDEAVKTSCSSVRRRYHTF